MPMKFKSTFVSQDSSQQESPSQSKQLLLTIKIIIFYTQADNKEMSREVEGGELLEQESQKKKKVFKSEQTHNVSKYNVRNSPKILKRFCDLMYSSPLKSSAHFHLSSFSLSTDTLTSGLRPV